MLFEQRESPPRSEFRLFVRRYHDEVICALSKFVADAGESRAFAEVERIRADDYVERSLFENAVGDGCEGPFGVEAPTLCGKKCCSGEWISADHSFHSKCVGNHGGDFARTGAQVQ